MCGICGVYRFAEDDPISPDGLETMKEMILHRGPNQEGTYVESFAGLGHRRLSIIGVSDGRQPLSNETGTVWISFNGEIYNYRPLKERLLAQGHKFATKTDTEVLVHLYEEKGADLVHEIHGMFAIAIWDREKRKLLLVRDRIGKKPLYYLQDSKQILFASELKAILAYPGVKRSPNLEALHHYLSLGYVPAPLTAFEGISTLPAGHLLEISRGGKSRVAPYWDVSFEPRSSEESSGGGAGDEALIDRLDEQFDDAVKVRLESEVPLGVFLSGGVDSSAVAHRMKRHLTQPLVSTTIRFTDPRYDESPQAKEVSDLIGTDHRVHEVAPGSTEIIERILWHFDEPFADASALPTFFLCKTARESLTVALSGDGGDEMFAGYERYRQIAREDALRRRIPGFLRKLLRPIERIYPVHGRGRALLENLNLDPAAAGANSFFVFGHRHKELLYSGGFRQLLAEKFRTDSLFRRFYEACRSPDPISKAQYTDYKSYLVDDICVKVDRMSMAHALEVRAPLLDHRLVELVASYPSTLKLREGQSKHIFKRMLERHLPASVLHRPKRGFGVPLTAWFRKEVRGLVESVLLDGQLFRRGYFERGYLEGLWKRQQDGNWKTSDLGTHFWMLLMLELWHRMYIDTNDFLRAGRSVAAAPAAGAKA
jgi:asparagine synthase (glutamine-hydrolysing)